MFHFGWFKMGLNLGIGETCSVMVMVIVVLAHCLETF
jgi:hypothetical protein